MHLKVEEGGKLIVTCEGETQKAVLKDLEDAKLFLSDMFSIVTKKKKRKPRKKKAAAAKPQKSPREASAPKKEEQPYKSPAAGAVNKPTTV